MADNKGKRVATTRKGKKRKGTKKTQNALVDLGNVIAQKKLIPEWLLQYAPIAFIALAVGGVSGLGYLMWFYWSWEWFWQAVFVLIIAFFALGLLIQLWTTGLILPLIIGVALEGIGEKWQLDWVLLVGHLTLIGTAIGICKHLFSDHSVEEERERAKKSMEKYKNYLINSGFRSQMCFVSSDYVSIIALDQSNEKIALADMAKGLDSIINVADVLSVEVSEDGQRSFEMNATTSGTSGLSIGAISSRGVTVGRTWTKGQATQGTLNESVLVHDISLVLETNDVEFPHISLNILGDAAVPKDSSSYKSALKEAKTWSARIKALQHRNKSAVRVKSIG